jgi:hypothetical protein
MEPDNSKSAVEVAKALHKRLSTAASEALLVRAYAARANAMREHRLAVEADALIAMVREKFPQSASLILSGAARPASVAKPFGTS